MVTKTRQELLTAAVQDLDKAIHDMATVPIKDPPSGGYAVNEMINRVQPALLAVSTALKIVADELEP